MSCSIWRTEGNVVQSEENFVAANASGQTLGDQQAGWSKEQGGRNGVLIWLSGFDISNRL